MGASLGNAPVGFISRTGAFGDGESFVSLGNAPVGVFQRRQYPQPWYQVPRIPVLRVHPPVRPPVVIKTGCRYPGPCRDQVVKPARPIRPPPPRPHYKPIIRPVRPPGKPVVRPPVKPGVRPPKRPIRPYVTRKPKTHRPRPKPGGVSGRSSGGLLVGGLLGGLGGLLGGR